MAADEESPTLFDLSSKEINPYWVDPKQPLTIPTEPLHWHAHELQLLLEILKKQAQKNPAQFNSKNYIDTLNAFTMAVTAIKEGKTINEVFRSGNLGSNGNTGTTPPMGGGATPSLDSGVSPDNPAAR